MNPLLLPYILNIIILVPIANMMLWGGERGGQAACEGQFPESEGFRTIQGALQHYTHELNPCTLTFACRVHVAVKMKT